MAVIEVTEDLSALFDSNERGVEDDYASLRRGREVPLPKTDRTLDRARRLAIVLMLSTTGAASATAGGISSSYPGDRGIQADPRVYFAENFEKTDINELKTAWPDYKNIQYMSLVSDIPQASSGAKSLLLDGTKGSSHWYRNLNAGDRVFVRFYVKHERGKHFHHDGVWVGGYNPPTSWPQGNAGRTVPPDTFFSVAPEGLDGVHTLVGDLMTLGFYNYWMGMSPDGTGTYWGENIFVGDGGRISTNAWYCIEYMIKLNDPVTSENGELILWINGNQIIHFGDGFPNGIQTYGIWRPDPSGTPYKGLQFRDDPNWGVNWVWLLNDPPGEYPGTPSGKVWVDDLVIASEYIGPISQSSQPVERPGAPVLLP